jgi:predicted nucleic acid-binding protein
MSEVVVDASVALCWFAREAESPVANRLIRSRTDLVAPSLLLAELANGFWKKIRRSEMRADIAAEAIREIRRFVPQIIDLSELAAQALELARETDHSVYDCCYLALALRRGVPIVTLDRTLVAGAARSGHARFAMHLADWIAE